MTGWIVEGELSLLGQDARTRFQTTLKKLDKSSVEVKAQLDTAAVQSEYQRFLLWATNLGLFQRHHSSLDYRLRDNEVIMTFTKSLLNSLIHALKEITTTVNEEDHLNNPSETSKSQQYDAEHVEGATCFTDDNASSLESYPILTGVMSDVDETMLALHFEDVIEAIDQLFKLASQIRSPASRKLRTDVDLYRDIDADVKSTYIRVREAAELQGIEQVFLQTRRTPLGAGDENLDGQLGQEDVVLVRRLQKANRLRRQQFEHWKMSKEKLVRATLKAEQNLDFLAKADTPKVQAQAKAPIRIALSVTQASQQLSSLPSSVPIVARDLVLKDNKSTYSRVSRGLTVHGPSGEILSWPKPPHPKDYGKDFECPYCFFICPTKYLSSEAAWRHHFKHDLRPYICTYDDCPEPTVLYDSWEDWVRHEQWAHRQRIWRCPDHPQHKFSERSEYEDHVNMQHADTKHLLLSSELLTAQESVSCASDRPCPFCLQDYDVFEMQQHIASHLETVALLSVPNLDEEKKATKGNSNSANSNHAESKAGDFDSTEVLLFPENEGPDHLRSSSGAEKRAFRTKLGIINQSFNEASSESVITKSRYYEDLVRDWLDGVRAGTRFPPKVNLKVGVIDTYKRLAQALRVISIEEDPYVQLLHISRAVLCFLPHQLTINPESRESGSAIFDKRRLSQILGYIYDLMKRHLGPLGEAPSHGPAIFVNQHDSRSTRKTRLNLGNSYEESTDTILRLVDNIIRLLESVDAKLKIDSVDAATALLEALDSRDWQHNVSYGESFITLELSDEEFGELVDDFRHSYQELILLQSPDT